MARSPSGSRSSRSASGPTLDQRLQRAGHAARSLVPKHDTRSEAVARSWNEAFRRGEPLSLEERGTVLRTLIEGGTYPLAAAMIGRSERFLLHARKADPEFQEQCELARRIPRDILQMSYFELAIHNKDVAALIFGMKNVAGWTDKKSLKADISVSVYPAAVERSFDVELPAKDVRELNGAH